MSDARDWVYNVRQTYDRDSVLKPTFAEPIINHRFFTPRFDFLSRPNAVRQNVPRGRDAQGLKKSRSNTFELGDKTLKKLLAVSVPDKRDTRFINTYNQLISERYSPEEAKRITIQRLGRTQHTITKMMNIGDTKASIDETLQMIQKIKIGNKDEAINQAMNMLNRLGEGDRLTTSQWNTILSLIENVDLGADPEKNGFNRFYNFTDFKRNVWVPPQKARFMIYTARRAREEGRHPDTPYRHDRFPQKVYAKDAFLQLFQRYKDSHVLYTEQLTLITPSEAKRIDPSYPLIPNKEAELDILTERDENPEREEEEGFEAGVDFPSAEFGEEQEREEEPRDDPETEEEEQGLFEEKKDIINWLKGLYSQIENKVNEDPGSDSYDIDADDISLMYDDLDGKFGEIPDALGQQLGGDLYTLLGIEDIDLGEFMDKLDTIIQKYIDDVDTYVISEGHSAETEEKIAQLEQTTSHLDPQSVDDVFDDLQDDPNVPQTVEKEMIKEAQEQFGTQLQHAQGQPIDSKREFASSSELIVDRLTQEKLLRTEELYLKLVADKGIENISGKDRVEILNQVNDEIGKLNTGDRLELTSVMTELQQRIEDDEEKKLIAQSLESLDDSDLDDDETQRVIDEAVNVYQLTQDEKELDIANLNLSQSLLGHHSGAKEITADDWRESMMMVPPPDPITSLAEEEDLTEEQIGDRIQNIFLSMLGRQD